MICRQFNSDAIYVAGLALFHSLTSPLTQAVLNVLGRISFPLISSTALIQLLPGVFCVHKSPERGLSLPPYSLHVSLETP